MAKTYQDMLWANVRQIRRDSDRQFATHILQARRNFLQLRTENEIALRKIYIKAADNVAIELKQLGTNVGELTRDYLAATERALRQQADMLNREIMLRVKDDLLKAAQVGSNPLANQLLDVVEKAGVLKLDKSKLQFGFAQVNTTAVEVTLNRTKDGLVLSDRIWNASQNATDTMRDLIVDGISRGRDAVQVARDLEQYVNKGAATLAKDYPNMMARTGTRFPKDISYEALRLARTEMTASFQEATYAAGQMNPSYKGARWMLSGAHPVEDICDELATADNHGLGPGCYPPGEEPYIPHPNCLCYTVPIAEDIDDLVERLKNWEDDPESEPDLEEWYQEKYLES